MKKYILLNLDVEEFDIPTEYGQEVPLEEQIDVTARGLDRVLDILSSLAIPVTCFTTVVFARGRADLVRQMTAQHEIGSHGVAHGQLLPADLAGSRSALAEIAGVTIDGFRPPRLAAAAMSAIAGAGYRYVSSENPIWLPGRYMNLCTPRLPYCAEGIVQLPISASPLIRYPLFWLSFKNTPFPLYKAISHWTLETDRYLNIYFHPWEFADLGPWRLPSVVKRVSGDAMSLRFTRYLAWLKSQGDFITCRDYAEIFRNRRTT